MAWNQILGHEHVKKILQAAATENRLPNAYCFWGIEGVGKDALAIELAKVLNCEHPVISGKNIDACGACLGCSDIAKLQHPNLSFIFSLPTGKLAESKSDSPLARLSEEQISAVEQQIDLKAGNPYHRISVTGANQIKIASVREIKKNLSLTSARPGRRCVIISNAEELTPEAQNAFLKTLEEPHDNVTIILTLSNKEAILPTILSRCQQIHCKPLSEELITGYLVANYHIVTDSARLISAFAQGSVLRAVGFLSDDLQEIRNLSVDVLRTTLKKNLFRKELLEYIDIMLKGDRKHIESILAFLALWLKDAYLFSLTNDDSVIINYDQADTIRKFAERFPGGNYELSIVAVQDSMSLIKRNVNQSLVLINLFIKIREFFLELKS